MDERGLGSVIAPEVVHDLSSAHVLTTKWVDGQRLADSEAEDVPRLCGVALNAYLTMLLDTGCLHCDPHPGNLLRTTDGQPRGSHRRLLMLLLLLGCHLDHTGGSSSLLLLG